MFLLRFSLPCVVLIGLTTVAITTATASTTLAQQASIAGSVMDQSGAALPGASVAAKNIDTGIQTAVTTNGEGFYSMPLLPPGQYTIAVALSGFRSQTRSGVTLVVQQSARLDFTLELGNLAE